MFSDNSFSLFNEPLDWFVDDFYKDEEYFSFKKLQNSSFKTAFKIRDYKIKLNTGIFEIKNYTYSQNKAEFEIKRGFNLLNFVNNYLISRDFKGYIFYMYERISFIQIPPKRVIIKDFDE